MNKVEHFGVKDLFFKQISRQKLTQLLDGKSVHRFFEANFVFMLL